MMLKEVYSINYNKYVFINTDNITYIERFLALYIIHLACGDKINVSKIDYDYLKGE